MTTTTKSHKARGEYTLEEFNKDYEKLDWDADDKVTFKEIKSFGFDRPEAQEKLVVSIVWIGHTLNPEYHSDILKNLVRGNFVKKGKDGSTMYPTIYPWFELTCQGEPICVNEYATRIASDRFTHVIQLDDHQLDIG